MKNANWVRKPQEQEGDYLFNGRMYATAGVMREIGLIGVQSILSDLKAFIKEKGRVDYLQVYENGNGQKIYCIDSVSQTMMKDKGFTPEEFQEYNYWTMLLPEEY